MVETALEETKESPSGVKGLEEDTPRVASL